MTTIPIISVNPVITTDETYFKMGEHNIGVEIAQRLNADIIKLEEQSKKEEMSTNVHNQE